MTTATTDLFTDEASQGILDLWFGPVGTNTTQEHVMRWFRPDTSFDLEIRTKFGPLLTTLTALPPSTLTTLATTPHRSLALLILLDQFPRNLFRGPASAHVYTTTDPLATAVATYSISQRLDLGPNGGEWRSVPSRRMWFWLSLMHSEDIVLHARVREEFLLPTAGVCRGGEVGEVERGMAEKLLDTGREHEELLEIFGRYPYRNKVLGRESTKEELKWLENPVQWAR